MCFCSEDYGVTGFTSENVVRARTPKRCFECEVPIQPGQLYTRYTMKWEGDISTTVFCEDCRSWSIALCDAQKIVCGCSGWELGNLWGEIREFSEEHLGYRENEEAA